jgi:hypothetical protein
VEEEMNRDGLPLPVFKKKGQKRTTRLVKMRPTRTKRPATAGQEAESDDEAVAETQINNAARNMTDEGLDLLSGSDFNDSGSDTAAAKKSKSGKKSESTVKRVVRKVKATAHANFKRLKLRNTGSKGGPGFNSRFRRRR